MNRQQKDLFLMGNDEIYAEAQRRIEECREKGLKKLDFSCLHLTKIPPEIAELETLAELDIRDIEMKKIPAFTWSAPRIFRQPKKNDMYPACQRYFIFCSRFYLRLDGA